MRTNVTKNPLAKNHSLWSLLAFSLPSIGMMIVISLYTVTDGIFIGRYAGSNALAASNIVYPAINLVLGLSIMLETGGSAFVAKTLGEKQGHLADRRFSLIILTVTVINFLLALTLQVCMTPLLHFLGASPVLYADCLSYLQIMLLFAPAMGLMTVFNSFYIADGVPKLGFFVATLSGVTNAVLDYVFLAHLGLGIFGAGLATGIGYTLAALIGFYYFSHCSRQIHFARPKWEGRGLLQVFSNGSSELVTQLAVGITTYLFNIIVFAWAGEDGIAAISVILYAEMLMTSILMGFSMGIAPIFSYQFGAQNYRILCQLLKKALVIILGFSLLAFASAQLFAQPLVRLFLPAGGHVFTLTLQGFTLFSFSFLLCGFNLFTSGFFTAISDGPTSALDSFVRNLLGIAAFLLTLPHLLGLNGVFLAVPAADTAALLLSLFLLIRQYKAFQQKTEPKQLEKLQEMTQTK